MSDPVKNGVHSEPGETTPECNNAKKFFVNLSPSHAVVISAIFAAVPSSTGVLMSYLSSSEQTKVKFAELAINILGNPPTNQNIALRGWAADVLKKTSPVPIGQAQITSWLSVTPVTSPEPKATYSNTVTSSVPAHVTPDGKTAPPLPNQGSLITNTPLTQQKSLLNPDPTKND
ncbi:MAG: hypothetical protein GC182_10520 [Rhodopseudomonas sp.]|nr:hypothetical protein [Rhodopseudomonas sp.]